MELTNNLRKQIILFVFTLVIFSVNSLKAETYYVSPSGNDSDNGNSQGTAWQTISQINSTDLSPGDSVLLEANGVWREALNAEQGDETNRIYYGRYGDGANPIILGSERVPSWTSAGTTNIWQAEGSYTNPHSGREAEIFFIKDDSTTWGVNQTYSAGFTNLTNEYDWTCNGNTIYVYAPSDPDTRYDSVEIPQRDQAIAMPNNEASYVEFQGIDLVYCKIRGFYAGYPPVYNQTDISFKDMRIAYVGEKNGVASYGISAHHSNFLAENCSFSDIGRRPISINMYSAQSPGHEIYLQNIVIRNNTFKRGYHTSSLDLAAEAVCTGDTVMDVFFYNNIVDDHDIEWAGNDRGSNQFYIQEGDGTGDNDDGGAYFNRIYCYNNVFIQSTRRNILVTDADTIFIWNNTIVGHNLNIDDSPYSNVGVTAFSVDYRNNILYSNWTNDEPGNNYGILNDKDHTVDFTTRDYNLYFQVEENHADNCFNGGAVYGYYTISEYGDYLADNPDFDQNSPWPEDPYFVDFDNFNFQLTDSSAANGGGVPISMIATDILGYPRDPEHPSIGAYEYIIPDSTATNIVRFNLDEQKSAADIDTSSHTVDIEVWYGTDVSSLKPNILVSVGASIDPASGVSRNFTSPQTYTVTAKDGTTQQTWTVTVTIADPSVETDIVNFIVPEQTGNAIINSSSHTVTLEVAYGTSLASLTPAITLSFGATIDPNSGIARDFSSSVIYTVTAQDGTTQQTWTVTITEADPPPPNNLPDININYCASALRGFVYRLDASGTTDADIDDELTYEWEIPAEFEASSLTEPIISILPTNDVSETTYSVTLNVSDGKDIVDETINIEIEYYRADAMDLNPVSIEASSSETGNEAVYIMDDDYDTRWSAEGDNQSVTFELDNIYIISHFELSFYAGDLRETYFEIYASTDNSKWDLIIERDTSCGFTLDLETFKVPNSFLAKSYKYIKLVGRTNSENAWNSYTEFKIYGYDSSVKLSQYDMTDDKVELYPNPADKNVYIRTDFKPQISLFDVSGKLLYEQNSPDNITEITFPFKQGVYFVQIFDRENIKTYTRKLIIK